MTVCRVCLTSVNRELRRWSTDGGDEVWRRVTLDLHRTSYADPAYWAEVRWLQLHIRHVSHLHLVIFQVRFA